MEEGETEEKYQCRTCGEWFEEYEMIDEHRQYCYIAATEDADEV